MIYYVIVKIKPNEVQRQKMEKEHLWEWFYINTTQKADFAIWNMFSTSTNTEEIKVYTDRDKFNETWGKLRYT